MPAILWLTALEQSLTRGIRPGDRITAIPRELGHSAAGFGLHKKLGWASAAFGRGRSWSGERSGRLLTVNAAVFLAIIVFLRLRRRTEARSRFDEKLTMIIVLALGVLIAPTAVGRGILDFLTELINGLSRAGQ